jgi:hypothetical protein
MLVEARTKRPASRARKVNRQTPNPIAQRFYRFVTNSTRSRSFRGSGFNSVRSLTADALK